MDGTPLANRTYVSIKNPIANLQKVYVGFSNAITATNASWELAPGDSIERTWTTTKQIWIMSASGTMRVMFEEGV